MRERYITFKGLIYSREIILVLILSIFILFSSLLSPYFFNLDNFRNIIIAISLDTIIIVGMTLVLVGGGIDLSVGSVLGFCATILARSFAAEINIPVAIIITLLCGIVIGAINGILIAYIRINPLIATLGMMAIARSGTYIAAGGHPLASIPSTFKAFAKGSIFGMPNLFIIGLLSIAIFEILLRKNSIFRKYYYIGGNEKTAYLAGIRVNVFKFFSYVATGLCSAIAAILLVSRLGSAFPHTGLGTEMRVISACIIGGCSITGGKGTILGSFLGVMLMAMIGNILVLTGIPAEWQGIVSGTILILAVLSDAIIQRREQLS